MIYLAWWLSFSVGLLSMAQEILWIRLIGFAFQGIPQIFSLVLTLFLAGISLGALLGKRLCSRINNLTLACAWILTISGLSDILLLISIPFLYKSLGFLGLGLLILYSAFLKGIIFPIAHHLGSIINMHLGRSISWVYFMNIMGSTLGPLIVGLWLLDHVSLSASMQLLAYTTLLVATTTWVYLIFEQKKYSYYGLTFFFTIAIASGFYRLDIEDHRLISSLINGDEHQLKTVIENKHGIIHTFAGDILQDDSVYGGNVYDGRTNIELKNNSNRVDRAYLIHALHPKPYRVLVIGLSSGAWARILLTNPIIKKLDVVEINPGYLELIRQYSHLSPILDDERVSIYIDDGRRWLKHHSVLRYDVIIMNTTFHWRSNVTNLLSSEMLRLAHDHLQPDGIFAFNTTGSDDAFFTASNVFSYARRYRNFVYASDKSFDSPHDDMKNRLFSLKINDESVFKMNNPIDNENIDKMLLIPFERIEDVIRNSNRQLEVITDQNMITEFRYGKDML